VHASGPHKTAAVRKAPKELVLAAGLITLVSGKARPALPHLRVRATAAGGPAVTPRRRRTMARVCTALTPHTHTWSRQGWQRHAFLAGYRKRSRY
jgi:hypothetical protein